MLCDNKMIENNEEWLVKHIIKIHEHIQNIQTYVHIQTYKT